MNPSTRLLPSGRGNNIHFYKKHRCVDPIHFTMSSSTKTTQPRDPAKSSHFRRKMAQHKRDQPKQAGAASTTSESYSLSTRELKNEQDIPSMAAAGPAQTGRIAAKTMSLTKWSSKISSVAGPVKTTNLAICSTKILSLANPTKTMSLTKWSSKISSVAGPVKTANLALWYENSVTGKPNKDHEPYKWSLKFSSVAPGVPISPVASPARPSNRQKPFKLWFQNFVRGRPTQSRPQT